MPPLPTSPQLTSSVAGRRHLRTLCGLGVALTALVWAQPTRAQAGDHPTPSGDAAPADASGAAGAAPASGGQAVPAPVTPQQAAPASPPPAPTPAPPAQQAAPPAQQAAPPAATTATPAGVAPKFDEEESLRPLIDENPTPRTRLDVAAWIGAGVTVALLGVAAFYGAKASEKADDVDRLNSNFDPQTGIPVEYATVADQYQTDLRDGRHDDRVAKGFAIAAGATALTSAALFVIDAVRHPGDDGASKPPVALAPIVTAGGAGVGVGASF